MSVHISSWVWKYSWHSGSDLLVLLALADMAHDDGICWPSLATLCERSRLSERYVRDIIRTLEDSSAVVTTISRGRGHSNVYRVMTAAGLHGAPLVEKGLPSAVLQELAPEEKGLSPVEKGAPSSEKGASQRPPSVRNHEENRKPPNRVPKPTERAVAPQEFSEFDRILIQTFGSEYVPTDAFWNTIWSSYRHLDLLAEAVKLEDYKRKHPKWTGTTAKILNWLQREKESREKRTQGTNGDDRRPGRASPDISHDVYGRTREERAAAERMGDGR